VIFSPTVFQNRCDQHWHLAGWRRAEARWKYPLSSTCPEGSGTPGSPEPTPSFVPPRDLNVVSSPLPVYKATRTASLSALSHSSSSNQPSSQPNTKAFFFSGAPILSSGRRCSKLWSPTCTPSPPPPPLQEVGSHGPAAHPVWWCRREAP
jgi:hypothetical protein